MRYKHTHEIAMSRCSDAAHRRAACHKQLPEECCMDQTTLRSPSSASAAPSVVVLGPARIVLLVIGAVAAIRLLGLWMSRVELDFEEAQYWDWSRHLAFGYFSKPPLIAWIIDATQRVCGDSESCIRSPAPLFYAGTGLLVFGAVRRLYDARTALWAALLVTLAPGVAFSARLMTTDVPLLFCVALLIYAVARLRERAQMRFWILFGIALGVGMLAKYAMIYVLAMIALLAVVVPGERRWIASRGMAVALFVAALVVAPNLGWNLSNGFSTFLHTRENIEGQGALFSPVKAAEFFAAQFALAGPIVFATFLTRLFGVGAARVDSDRLLLVFSAPVILGLTAYAFVVRANPNWGAAGVIAAIALASAVLAAHRRQVLLYASLALAALVQAALLVGDAFPERVRLPGLTSANPYERVLGWEEIGRQVERAAREANAQAIATEDRRHVALFTYYLRGTGLPVLVWSGGPRARNHFEANAPLSRATPQPVLFLTQCENIARLSGAYADVTLIGVAKDTVARASLRRFFLVTLARPHGDIPAPPPCQGPS